MNVNISLLPDTDGVYNEPVTCLTFDEKDAVLAVFVLTNIETVWPGDGFVTLKWVVDEAPIVTVKKFPLLISNEAVFDATVIAGTFPYADPVITMLPVIIAEPV